MPLDSPEHVHYRVTLVDADDSPPAARLAAERRFRRVLDEALGDPAMVLPVYRAWQRIAALHGEQPDLSVLTEPEQAIATQWMQAYTAALAAAVGTHRYMGDALVQIDAPP